MKNRNNKSKARKKGEKGGEDAFGCDLTEHLQSSGHGVPQVLKTCAEFIEQHGVVDGIYRLSGVTSNIQRLRQEFCSEACPDLSKEVYLQDIHCVGSLCKLYFRELPDPLLTYQLYSRFTELVSVQGDQERLVHIQRVIRDLPDSHFRTLEYLTRHLAHLATFSTQTNMHTRNLALVWAPNLLRCKDIEASSANGDMAFQEVRIQQSVVEFILRHTQQIFSGETIQTKPREGGGGGGGLLCGEKYATLPLGAPMKLMSLEEAQARSLSPNHPLHPQRQRENSLPDASATTLYHTVIDITDKRKFSGKSKRWKSIFNLGRSVESKGKLSRNGSVFIRAQGNTEKPSLRPSRSMESLCSLPTDDERTGSPSGGAGSIFIPGKKSRTLGSDSLYEHDHDWDARGNKAGGGAAAGWSSGVSQGASPGASAAPQKSLPEQLKVFKGDEVGGYKPTSPKNRRMLYSGSAHSSSSSRPSFPGSFFPLESSPRHQRRAVNISEPFAVSVPLRVSAVISSNSTPCRVHAKDKAATLKPCRETPEQSGGGGGRSNTIPQQEAKKKEEEVRRNEAEMSSMAPPPQDTSKEVTQETQGEKTTSGLETLETTSGATAPPAGSGGNSPHEDTVAEQDSSSGEDLWSELHQELRISEPEIDLLDETAQPVFLAGAYGSSKLTMEVKSKRSRSSPSLSLLCREQTSQTSLTGSAAAAAKKQPSESDILFSLHKHSEASEGKTPNVEREKKLEVKLLPADKEEAVHARQSTPPSKGTREEEAVSSLIVADVPLVARFAEKPAATSEEPDIHQEDVEIRFDGAKPEIPEAELVQRLTACLEERRSAVEQPNLDEDGGGGEGNWEELDLLESWEDLHAAQQWVTSPLHSPDLDELFNHLVPFGCHGDAVGRSSSRSADDRPKSGETFGEPPQAFSGGTPEANERILPPATTRLGLAGKSGTARQKNAAAASHRFNRQLSHESAVAVKRDESSASFRLRPCSLNLDLRPRYIRDISNQQDRHSSEFPSAHRGPAAVVAPSCVSPVTSVPPSDLQLFLSHRQAPLRRNSAPVSVSSVRTAFMIKTCQAKAVPVVPPKVQYSQIPNARHGKDAEAAKEREKERPKTAAEKSNSAPPPMMMSDLKEELENKEPTVKLQRHPSGERAAEGGRKASTPELPAMTRRRQPSLEVFVDAPRANKAALLQRPSFRNRQRPQSLILLSPPFPIMDYPPPPGDDARLLPPIKSLNEVATAASVFSKDGADGIQNKMTIPKSGQRLETSTSCFYQPQRRSMIYEGRSHRQIE